MSASVNQEASVDNESVRTEGVVAGEDKKTPDSSVPNVIITCTADDDIDTATDALHMVDVFHLPTADEVMHSHIIIIIIIIILCTYIAHQTKTNCL